MNIKQMLADTQAHLERLTPAAAWRRLVLQPQFVSSESASVVGSAGAGLMASAPA